jgi:hypothetical protein
VRATLISRLRTLPSDAQMRFSSMAALSSRAAANNSWHSPPGSVPPRHDDIGEEYVDALPLDDGQRLSGALSGEQPKTVLVDDSRERVAHEFVIVDEEDGECWRRPAGDEVGKADGAGALQERPAALQSLAALLDELRRYVYVGER